MSGILQGLLASIGAAGGPWLYAWGNNSDGRLGDNTIIRRSSPVQIGDLTTWSKVSCGNYHSISIKTDGTLWTWGYAQEGQLGHNNLIERSSPVQVGALTTWAEVAGLFRSTVAIKTDGTLWSWGSNTYGVLGDGTTIPKSSPVQIGNLTNWSKISGRGNFHCVAIKTDGTLWAWGQNYFGNLGDNTTIKRSSPVQIGALTTWSQAYCGGNFTVAIKTDGTLWSWGYGAQGQLGLNISYTNSNRSSPIQVGALTNWSKVSAGDQFTIAVKTDGTLWTWGRNIFGQLGTGDVIYRSSPVQVGALTTWSQVAAGDLFAVAIKTDKTLWTWGSNTYGRLGDNTNVNKSSPIQIGSNSWAKIACGGSHTIAIED